MIDRQKARLPLLASAGYVAFVLAVVTTACRETPPARATETPTPGVVFTYVHTPEPTRPRTRPTPAPCCARPVFPPPMCGIIPGQSTMEDVEGVLGTPPTSNVLPSPDEGYLPRRAETQADTIWRYLFECPVEVVFKDGVVFAVRYNIRTGLDLEDAIAAHGPPEKVLAVWIQEDIPGYWSVDFLWPAEGVIIQGGLSQAIEEPDEAPPFQADLDIGPIWYFQPGELEQAMIRYGDLDVLFDWPGMTE